MLLVRKAYQIGRGRDDKGLPGGEANGTVVAAYRIESHFDIRKAYNPVTGEELNITEENTSDRPWYEREYFRVDWSTNEVANPMYLDELFSKWFGDPKITPMRYQVTDPTSEDAPFVDEKEGYIEVTNRVFVEPGEMYFSWGSLPSCEHQRLQHASGESSPYVLAHRPEPGLRTVHQQPCRGGCGQ